MEDLRVLIADDDPGMRTIMRRIVSKVEGFVLAAEAGDGKTALELVEQIRPHVVFLDVEMPEMMRVEEDLLLDMYGIKAEQYKQVEVYLCVNSLRADEIWLIEAVSETALAELKALAEFRLTAKDEESVTYSPEQNAVVKKAHLATYGNYLVMIVSPEVEAITAAFKAEAGV